ncbi:hypothetical protein SAMN04488595_103393 [Ralstonia sp. 25mfcol4.1]|uniref:hypothetical protein n=1 Tax=Burkholderiaceae TaxID=119060 RepID=UPI000891BC7B|nr:hypothetical protein [Ralstonia sp. 25mfcol4.1]SDO98831.1 hypothetical protein SAMN04488595_103393 [Ralstonia sp. 25mfcol4.1]
MKNPWLKKNPWLSLWLSGANGVIGAARGHALSEGGRQTATAAAAVTKAATDAWLAALTPPKPARKRTSQRRRK